MPSESAEELLAQRAWLRTLAARLVRDEAERDDLVQEAWLAALQHIGAGTADWRRWLAGVVRNRWRFARRTAERRAERERESAQAESFPSAAELAQRAELQRLLVGTVLALEEPYRSTVLLRYFGGLSSRAIARRENLPQGTVRSRLKRALDQLRAELDRRNGGERRAWALALVPLARGGGPSWAGAAASVLLLLVLGAGGWKAVRELTRAGDGAPLRVPALAQRDRDARDGHSDGEAGATVAERALPQALPDAGTERRPLDPSAHAAGRSGVAIHVIDPEEAPIPGAGVTWWKGEEEMLVTADEEGRAFVPVRNEGGTVLRIQAPGFVTEQAKFGLESPGGRIDLGPSELDPSRILGPVIVRWTERAQR
jgi:RNA polymerase sigma-70 factor (ECF subfamily)